MGCGVNKASLPQGLLGLSHTVIGPSFLAFQESGNSLWDLPKWILVGPDQAKLERGESRGRLEVRDRTPSAPPPPAPAT